MSVYQRMKHEIEQEAAEEKRLRGQALSSMEVSCLAETKALIQEIIGGDERIAVIGDPQRDQNGQWFIALGDEFHFTKKPGYEVTATMQPTICTKGCRATITNKEDFVNFVKNHLSHKNHEPHF